MISRDLQAKEELGEAVSLNSVLLQELSSYFQTLHHRRAQVATNDLDSRPLLLNIDRDRRRAPR